MATTTCYLSASEVSRGRLRKERARPLREPLLEGIWQKVNRLVGYASVAMKAAATGGAIGAVANMLTALRRRTVEERRAQLEKENASDLKALCIGLRLKTAGGKEGMITRIEDTLMQEATLLGPDKPIGRMVRVVNKVGNAAKIAQKLKELKVKDLQQMCVELRLPKSGKKDMLIERISDELQLLATTMDLEVHSEAAGESRAQTIQSGNATSPAHPTHAQKTQAGPSTEIHVSRMRKQTPQQQLDANPQVVRGKSQGKSSEIDATSQNHPAPSSSRAAQQTLNAKHNDALKREPQAAHPRGQTPQGHAAASSQFRRSSTSPADTLPRKGESPGGTAFTPESSVGSPSAASSRRNEVDRRSAEVMPERDDHNVIKTVRRTSPEEQKRADLEKRQLERSRKLTQYAIEELSSVFGEHKDRYNKSIQQVFQSAPSTTQQFLYSHKVWMPPNKTQHRVPSVLGPGKQLPEISGYHSEAWTPEMKMIGEIGPSRIGMCSWWNMEHSCGEVLDRETRETIAVLGSALQTAANVHPKLKYLKQGEWVQYRRVQDEDKPRGVLVGGIDGWPLMCEVESSNKQI